MFRMVPGIDMATSDRGRLRAPIGRDRRLVRGARRLLPRPAGHPARPREVRPGETEMAQRSAAIVAATYRAEVDIDRRDRMLLVSYDEAGALNADRFAWAVCDTIRTVPDSAGSARVLRDWQVVAMPYDGMPGSCRIGE